MDIIDKIARLFFKKKETPLRKSLLTLIVATYDASYVVFDRRSGKPTESLVEEYDPRYHRIWIEDEEHYRELFSVA